MSQNPIVRSTATQDNNRRFYRIYKELIEHKDPALNYYEHHLIEILVDPATNDILMASLINGVFGEDIDALKDEVALINKAMTLPILTEDHIPESAWTFEDGEE